MLRKHPGVDWKYCIFHIDVLACALAMAVSADPWDRQDRHIFLKKFSRSEPQNRLSIQSVSIPIRLKAANEPEELKTRSETNLLFHLGGSLQNIRCLLK